MNSKKSDTRVMLEILANENSRAVLQLTSIKEYSADELSIELGIAPATIYRNLNHLKDAGMLQLAKTIVDYHGNEKKYYRCSVRRIIIDISNGKLDINFEKEDNGNKVTRLWKRIGYS
jgi:predicted transcriptional regulator